MVEERSLDIQGLGAVAVKSGQKAQDETSHHRVLVNRVATRNVDCQSSLSEVIALQLTPPLTKIPAVLAHGCYKKVAQINLLYYSVC